MFVCVQHRRLLQYIILFFYFSMYALKGVLMAKWENSELSHRIVSKNRLYEYLFVPERMLGAYLKKRHSKKNVITSINYLSSEKSKDM